MVASYELIINLIRNYWEELEVRTLRRVFSFTVGSLRTEVVRFIEIEFRQNC